MIWNFLTSAFLELDNCRVDQQRDPAGSRAGARSVFSLFCSLVCILLSSVWRLHSKRIVRPHSFRHHHDPGRSCFLKGRGGGFTQSQPHSANPIIIPRQRKISSCEVSSGCICFGTAVPAHWTLSTCWGRMKWEQRLQEETRRARCLAGDLQSAAADWSCALGDAFKALALHDVGIP